MKDLEYPKIDILPEEEQRTEDGDLKGVNMYDYYDNEILISIPREYWKMAGEIKKESCFDIEETYKMWTINGLIHEELHWILYELGFCMNAVDEAVHYIMDDIVPYPERECRDCPFSSLDEGCDKDDGGS